MLRTSLCLLVLVLASLPTARASAAFDGDLVRIFAAGDLGFGGTLTDDDLGKSGALTPSYGWLGGFDIGVHDFVAVGLMVNWDSIKLSDDALTDFSNAATSAGAAMVMNGMGDVGAVAGQAAIDSVFGDRATLFDVALYPRLRLPLPILEPYVMVPVGYTTYTPPAGDSSSGMSLGLTGGLGLTIFPFVKMLAEIGYQMYFLDGTSIAEPRANLGLAIGF